MLLGNVRSRYRGRGMEFEEVRHYQPGDDVRSIDWKVSARLGGTYTKLFCEERERPCHILVDQRQSLFFGSAYQFKSVLAAEVAAALGWAALAGGDRVGGQVLGDTIEHDCRARRNTQAVLRLIHDIHDLNHALYEIQANPDQELTASNPQSLANSLEECHRITRPGTSIYLVSDFHDFDQAAVKALTTLGKHTDITLIQINDPIELEIPLLGSVAISDGQASSRMRISKSIQHAYLSEVDKRILNLKTAAAQSRAHYAHISTTESARDALVKIFGV